MSFDPGAAAASDSGIFGLPSGVGDSRFIIVPVPFDATTSYRNGTRHGPAAVLEASKQVDLFDIDFGRPYEQGIAMLPLNRGPGKTIADLNRTARRFSGPIIEVGGEVRGDKRLTRALQSVNEIGEEVNRLVDNTVSDLLKRGKIPAVLGGDHSTPFGAIRAYGRKFPGLGILHIDAHCDLRVAFEGFEWSHASIMNNVVRKIGAAGGIASLVQVGIRDFSEEEFNTTRRRARRGETEITTYFDAPLHQRKFAGDSWNRICDGIVRNLPDDVYVSFDIDGLDPALCPDTGTPVPGGLSFNEMLALLRAVVRAKRRIVGFDLNEVAPARPTPKSDWGSDWNANVGARVLYKLIGAASNCR